MVPWKARPGPGTEVLINYGRKSNEELLLLYGEHSLSLPPTLSPGSAAQVQAALAWHWEMLIRYGRKRNEELLLLYGEAACFELARKGPCLNSCIPRVSCLQVCAWQPLLLCLKNWMSLSSTLSCWVLPAFNSWGYQRGLSLRLLKADSRVLACRVRRAGQRA